MTEFKALVAAFHELKTYKDAMVDLQAKHHSRKVQVEAEIEAMKVQADQLRKTQADLRSNVTPSNFHAQLDADMSLMTKIAQNLDSTDVKRQSLRTECDLFSVYWNKLSTTKLEHALKEARN